MSQQTYRPGLQALFDVVHRLRQPGGCPWDREQTHESLRPFLLEEAYEALEAIDTRDDAKLKEELGDVLLQVAMHSEIAAETGRFDAAQVSEAAAAKMVARHPHVFGDVVADNAEQVLANWEQLKRAEAPRSDSLFASVPRTLPALARAHALQTRAARNGRGDVAAVEAQPVLSALARLADATDQAERFALIGEILFGVVALARDAGVDPEDALRLATTRFEKQVL